MKKQKGIRDLFSVEVDVSSQDLRKRVIITKAARKRLGLLKGNVGESLYKLLTNGLAGFSPEIQLEMASCMVDFYFFKMLTFTGCRAVDATLMESYLFIGSELGIITVDR